MRSKRMRKKNLMMKMKSISPGMTTFLPCHQIVMKKTPLFNILTLIFWMKYLDKMEFRAIKCKMVIFQYSGKDAEEDRSNNIKLNKSLSRCLLTLGSTIQSDHYLPKNSIQIQDMFLYLKILIQQRALVWVLQTLTQHLNNRSTASTNKR